MKKQGLIQQISDSFLKDEPDMKDWLKEPSLQTSWQLLIIYYAIYLGLIIAISFFPLYEYLTVINNGIFWYRVCLSLFALGGLYILFSMTFRYFKYTIEKGNPIKLGVILYIYAISIGLFFLVYYFFFCSKPDLFQYSTLHISWSPLPNTKTYDAYATKLYFLFYSAFESIGGNFSYLQSDSLLVSIINYTQTLYSFSLVSLLIAGYINQKTNKSA